MLVNSVSMSVLLLCCVVIVFPGVSVRAAFIAAVVAANLDMFSGMLATSGVGLANALKLGCIAFALYFKTRHLPVPAMPRAIPTLWILLVAYAGLTLLWSEFVPAGIKQIGYFVAYTLVTLALYRVLMHYGLRVYRWLGVAFLIAIGLAVLQTWVLGNPFGEAAGRITGFSASQTFGLFLGMTGPLLIATGFTVRPRLAVPAAMAGLTGATLLLNGSRTGLLMFLFLCGWAFVGWFRGTGYGNRAVGALTAVATAIVVTVLAVGVMRPGSGEQATARATEGLLLVTGQRDYRDIGTLRWRLGMYAAIAGRLIEGGPREWVLGHGLSGTADIVASGSYNMRQYTLETVDANRIAHNEWLRSLYEFGVTGFVLLLLLFAAIFRLAWRVLSQHATAEAAVLFGIVLCLFALLSTQNVFAASIAPHGFILSLVVARLMCLDASEKMLSRVQSALADRQVRAMLLEGRPLAPPL